MVKTVIRRRDKKDEDEGSEEENYDFEDNESSEMETDDFSDGDENENNGYLKQKKDTIQGRIRTARNWMIANVLFLVFVITLLAIFYGLGWLKFETRFNESIN
jgi:hypothetical protein